MIGLRVIIPEAEVDLGADSAIAFCFHKHARSSGHTGSVEDQCSQPASPSGFGYAWTDPGFCSDSRAGLWETGFQKRKPGPAWVTCRPQVINSNLNLQQVISTD